MSSKKYLSAQLNLVCSTFEKSLVGLSDEACNQRPHENVNHIKYIAGHLLNAMYGMGIVAGANLERKWDDIFAGGGKSKIQDNFNYPTIEEIKAEWNKICPQIQAAFEKLPEEKLSKELPNSFLKNTGIFDGTIGDFFAFMNQHQFYHIGQIGIIRKMQGQDSMRFF